MSSASKSPCKIASTCTVYHVICMPLADYTADLLLIRLAYVWSPWGPMVLQCLHAQAWDPQLPISECQENVQGVIKSRSLLLVLLSMMLLLPLTNYCWMQCIPEHERGSQRGQLQFCPIRPVRSVHPFGDCRRLLAHGQCSYHI